MLGNKPSPKELDCKHLQKIITTSTAIESTLSTFGLRGISEDQHRIQTTLLTIGHAMKCFPPNFK